MRRKFHCHFISSLPIVCLRWADELQDRLKSEHRAQGQGVRMLYQLATEPLLRMARTPNSRLSNCKPASSNASQCTSTLPGPCVNEVGINAESPPWHPGHSPSARPSSYRSLRPPFSLSRQWQLLWPLAQTSKIKKEYKIFCKAETEIIHQLKW